MRGKILDNTVPVNGQPASFRHELDGDDLYTSDDNEELSDALGGIAGGKTEQAAGGELCAGGGLIEGS